MRFSVLSVALGTVLLASAAASAQIPQTPGSGILLTQCDPRPYNNTVESAFRVTPYKSSLRAILAMEYRNEAASAATAVVFGLVSGGKLVGIGEDSGTFSRGALVSHDLMLSEEIFPLGSQTHCVVLRVKFANGTAWFNPAAPTLQTRQ